VSPVARATAWLLDLVGPRRCAACDGPLGGPAFCAACARRLEGAPRRLRLAGLPLLALGSYREPLSTAILRLKQAGRSDLAAPLADELAIRAAVPDPSALLVPVPLHPRRLAARGYNQSALIARALARRWGVGSLPLALRRTRDTTRQMLLDRAARLENVRGAFEARAARPLAGRPLVVVDDVVTTGATVEEALLALSRAGAKPVAVVALAATEQDV
jgi:ComF family protein